MGGSSWSDDVYSSKVSSKAAAGIPTFDYDHKVKTGAVAAKVSSRLDPMGLKVRESRDSTAHPESNAIIVVLDETGSMGSVAGIVQGKLPTLMGLLTRKSYITDPQILFSAVGDAKHGTEKAPLQVGQFESGTEMDDDITQVYLEGAGGGTMQESYELMAYVAARHTATDCFEKRGKKGYMFFIGDERSYDAVSKEEVSRLMGHNLQGDIPTKEIFKELREKYEVFFILPEGASHGGDLNIIAHWKELVGGEHVLQLSDASAVAETIALQIGLCEGTTDTAAAKHDMVAEGSSEALVHIAAGAVSKAYAGGQITKIAPGALTPSTGGSSTSRL